MKKRVAFMMIFGLMILRNPGKMNACFVASAQTNTVLYVSGGILTDEISQYFADEGVEININCAYSDATDVQRIILAEVDVPDVFVLDVDDGFWGLVQKGYLEAIDDSSMTDEVHEFYPAIRSVVTDQEGQIVAIPEYFMPVHWCANETAWKQVLGDKPYPETFLELAELLELWKNTLEEEYPEYKLLEFSGDSYALMLDVIKQYIFQCESAQQPVGFEDAMLINTLEKLRNLNLQSVTEAMEDEYFNQKPLLTMQPMGGFGVEYMDGCRYVPIFPPRLTHDSPTYVPARMRVMVVNPHTRNKTLAYAYVKLHWENQTAAVKAAMIENWNTPVFSQLGMEELRQIEQEIERTEEQLSDAIQQEDLEKEEALRIQMSTWSEKREKVLKTAFEVSDEDIEAYSAIGPHVNLLFGSPYANEDDSTMQSIARIIRQFADGKMTAEQCVRKLEEIAQMVAQENKASLL